MKNKRRIIVSAVLIVLCIVAIKTEVFPVACARINEIVSNTVTIEFNNNEINSSTRADVSPDIKQLAFCKGTKEFYIEDLKTHEVKTYPTQEKIYQVKFSPDGTYLAAGRQVLNLKTGKMILLNTNAVIIGSGSWDYIAFSPESETLALVNKPGRSPDAIQRPTTIELWNLKEEKLIQTLPIQEVLLSLKILGPIFEMTFSPDGNTLAVGGNVITLWDVRTGKYIKALATQYASEDKSIRHNTTYGSVAYSPDGKYLAAAFLSSIVKQGLDPGTQEEMVEIWDIDKGTVVKTLKDPDWYQIKKVKYSPDGQYIAVGSDRGGKHQQIGDAVWIWNVSSGNVSRKLTQFPDYSTISMSYSADGNYVSASGNWHTKIWKLQ